VRAALHKEGNLLAIGSTSASLVFSNSSTPITATANRPACRKSADRFPMTALLAYIAVGDCNAIGD
jgi:hypothetical protein